MSAALHGGGRAHVYWLGRVAASTTPDMDRNRGSDDRGGRSLGREMEYPGRQGMVERRRTSSSWEDEERPGSQPRLRAAV